MATIAKRRRSPMFCIAAVLFSIAILALLGRNRGRVETRILLEQGAG